MAISKTIYLDSLASASSSEFAVTDNFANPNSIHEAGRDAFAVMEAAREDFAKLIGAKRPSEIIWTSGATEANNIAILGIPQAITPDPKRGQRNKIIVFEIEHESALLPAKHLAHEGYDVQILPTDRNGFAKLMKFVEICDDRTALVIMQHANTEIGSIQNVAEFCEIAHENGALFHCDCVGSFGQVPINVEKYGFDSASFSGHKFGAPKGIGALYLKANTPCKPIIFGGSQERELRPGTQSVALTSAFAKAAEITKSNYDAVGKNYEEFTNLIASEIGKLDGVRLSVPFKDNKMGYL